MSEQQSSAHIFQEVEPLFGPDHTQLPESENDTSYKPFIIDQLRHTRLQQAIVNQLHGAHWHPQLSLLTDCIAPVLQQQHPHGDYFIGQTCSIYWNVANEDLPLEQRVVTPAWFYVPDVAAMPDSKIRWLYHLWTEFVRPLIIVDIVADENHEIKDHAAQQRSFRLYERGICAPFYVRYDVSNARIEAYALTNRAYHCIAPNERGNYIIERLHVGLGVWHGQYQNMELSWLRWYDLHGTLLPTSDERADTERQRADRLAAILDALGVTPEGQI